MARTQTIVQLTSEMVAALDVEALRTGISRSALIRDAIESYLEAGRERQITVQLVAGYNETPQGARDEWGDVAKEMRDNTTRTLQRLDREEEEADLQW